MTAAWLSLEALDVWFFRDGRPFDAGDAHIARSQFPPPPETLLGALRALLLDARFGNDVGDYLEWLRAPGTSKGPPASGFCAANIAACQAAERELGVGPDPGTLLTICGPFVVREAEGQSDVLLPAPRDLLKQKSGGLVRLDPSPLDGDPLFADLAWNANWLADGRPGTLETVPLATPPEVNAEELESGPAWVSLGNFENYLLGNEMGEAVADPVRKELRSGIALETTGTARPGYLYEIELVRLLTKGQHTRLLASVEPAPETGDTWHIPFGGESRVARAHHLSNADSTVQQLTEFLAYDFTADATGWLRVVFLQPAMFKQGWIPDAVDPDTGIVSLGNFTFKLRGAAVGKPQAISGWDLRRRRPKALRYAVPAGSVYYFQLEDDGSGSRHDAIEAFRQAYHGNTAFQRDDKAGCVGYGLAVVGGCLREERTSAHV